MTVHDWPVARERPYPLAEAVILTVSQNLRRQSRTIALELVERQPQEHDAAAPFYENADQAENLTSLSMLSTLFGPVW